MKQNLATTKSVANRTLNTPRWYFVICGLQFLKFFVPDLQHLFPQQPVLKGNFTVVTICQKTENDMTTWSEQVDEERDALHILYSDTAQELCQTLWNAGYWADFIDPSSGRPVSFLNVYVYSGQYKHLTYVHNPDMLICKKKQVMRYSVPA